MSNHLLRINIHTATGIAQLLVAHLVEHEPLDDKARRESSDRLPIRSKAARAKFVRSLLRLHSCRMLIGYGENPCPSSGFGRGIPVA
jgi:hypothetical protein